MKTPIIIGIKIALDVWINLRRYVYKTLLKISEPVYFGAIFLLFFVKFPIFTPTLGC